MMPLRIDADEIVGKDALNDSRVAAGDRFRPLTFTLDDVALCFLLIVMSGGLAKRTHHGGNNEELDLRCAHNAIIPTRAL